MKPAINIYCQPTPLMFAVTGSSVLVQIDEAGRVQADEAGNVLTPDPEIMPQTVQADENANPLTDEAGAVNLPDPLP